jgi:hypothetical protein
MTTAVSTHPLQPGKVRANARSIWVNGGTGADHQVVRAVLARAGVGS